MKIYKDYDLKELNTFGIRAFAKFFIELELEKDLEELFNLPEFKNNKKMFLGGGSNVLFITDFDGIIILNKLKGISITEEDSENVYIRGVGGEYWHDLVMFAVNGGYWGIENLALIPGTVGAAPIQNIGAYGAELKEVLFNVETFEIETGKKKIFSKEECELGYRDSVFKSKLKNKYFILAVTLKLNKTPKPNFSYKILKEYLEKSASSGGNKIEDNSPKDISDAVMSLRQSKLPDPKILCNAGSFFKNVFIEKKQLQALQINYPNMPFFEDEKIIKIPAGWLIEQCGWKGHKTGNVGVYEKQSLVLANYGEATGLEIVELANKIIISVKEKFGLELVPEVNIV